MDIADLLDPIWVFRSETSGEWQVRQFSVGAMIALQEHLEASSDEAAEAIRCVMGEVLYRDEKHTEGSKRTKPTKDELSAFDHAEIERFAREFIENNPRLAEENEVPRHEELEQTASEYLFNILAAETRRQGKNFSEAMGPIRERLSGVSGSLYPGLGRAVQGLLRQSEAMAAAKASGILGGSLAEQAAKAAGTTTASLYSGLLDGSAARHIAEMEGRLTYAEPASSRPSLPIPDLTHLRVENPAHKTNDHLMEMNVRLENLIGFGENALNIMHELQVASAEFLQDFAREAKSNSKAAKRAILVGFLAVTISICQILYTEFWRTPQDSAAMDAAVADVRRDITNLIEIIRESAQADKVLEQGLSNQLEQQNRRDTALMEALSAISASINATTD